MEGLIAWAPVSHWNFRGSLSEEEMSQMTSVDGIRVRPTVSFHNCASEQREGGTQLVLMGFVCDSVAI